MNKINILTSDIYNKIAAGEVVERPASVVKELIENSVDAGATEIVVQIEEGGTKRISVLDNGGGISPVDLEKAFLPHATSKISSADDLGEIKTLGFRGEALSSIAAVSKVASTSKTIDSDTAMRLELTAGHEQSYEAVSANNGTHIEVEDLFFNVPARKKFLKTPSREGGEINNFITRLILANPSIKIKYIADGKTVYDFKGSGIEEAIFMLYGKECLDNCLYVESSAKNVKISGYIASPEYTKSNTGGQTIIINGRYVNCAVVSAALKNAYSPFLMTRQYPFYVLYIDLPADEIDVNVHPSKLEVKFLYGQDVFMAAYLAAKDTLANASKLYKQKIQIKTEPFSGEEQYANVSMFPPKNTQGSEFAMKLVEARLAQTAEPIKPTFEAGLKPKPLPIEEPAQTPDVPKTQSVISKGDVPLSLNGEMPANAHSEGVMQPALFSDGGGQKQGIFSDAKFLGIVFDTYIMLERGDFLFIIDQHAAHERILYDIYTEQYNKNEIVTQPLLVPYVFETTDAETNYIRQNMNNLGDGGFEVEEFGHNTFKLNAIPTAFTGLSVDKFVKEVLTNIRYFDMSTSELTRDMLARRACKAAIKAGNVLDRADVYALLQQLDEKENLKCPHGRPIVVVYSIVEFEKWFKRIV